VVVGARGMFKRLDAVSTYSIRAVVAYQAVAGLMAFQENVSFLANVAGVNGTCARILLFSLYIVKLATVGLLFVPVLYDWSFILAVLYGTLACTLAVECVLAASAGDTVTQSTTLVLIFACLKHAVVAACSRRLRIYSGSVGEDSMSDELSSFLRERASRYKMAPTACIGIGAVLSYTLYSSEYPFSPAPLARTIGRAQYARGAAFVALLAAVGSEDRSTKTYGRKKSL